MTRFIDLTQEKKEGKEKTEFTKHISGLGDIDKADSGPDYYDEVKLVSRCKTGFDLMVASKDGDLEYWYLGNWNDGC